MSTQSENRPERLFLGNEEVAPITDPEQRANAETTVRALDSTGDPQDAALAERYRARLGSHEENVEEGP